MKLSKARDQHSPGHDRWLVSYADFITLLFAFFVVLYASAELDKKKIAQLSAAIEGGFQQMGAFAKAPDFGERRPESPGLAANAVSNLPAKTDGGPGGLVDVNALAADGSFSSPTKSRSS